MNIVHVLGWALVHSLWQGTLAAAGFAALMAVLPARAARTRYGVAVATLVLMLVLPLATVLQPHDRPATAEATPLSGAFAPVSPSAAGSAGAQPEAARPEAALVSVAPLAVRTRTVVEGALPWVVAAWLCGVLLLSLRLASGVLTAHRLATIGTRPPPDRCREALSRLAARLRVTRPVRILESAVVQVPAVIGWLRPVILLPASALTGLTPFQLDALLAHELAHVRRCDYLVNLFQCVIETLLFYHPAVWWVSRRVREEREHCCDDLAVAVCGDAQVYALALVGMERLRGTAPALALALRRGSLAGRIRRLVAPVEPELFPRGVAGVVAVTLLLALAGGARAGAGVMTVAPTAAAAAPDTVLRHPHPGRPLAERWGWARAQAPGIGGRGFWIGYRVRPSARGQVVPGGIADVAPRDLELRGDVPARGVQLAPLVGNPEASDGIALLFRFVSGAAGRPVLARVQVSSLFLPVDFGREPLVWLGAAEDGASLAQLRALFAQAPTPELKEDLVAAVGMHDSPAVVPVLAGWLRRDEPAAVRAEVAEWLGHQTAPAVVPALARVARSDRASDVRREAAEALGDNLSPVATDSLLGIARTLPDRRARRDVVEELGERRDSRVRPALIAIARHDRDADVQREAVEKLGALPDGGGITAVIDIARSHPRSEVRRQAVQTIADDADPDVSLALLNEVALRDSDGSVQREAVERLGKRGGPRAFALLVRLAHRHPVSDVRREAVDALGGLQGLSEDSVAAALEGIALDGTDTEVQREAVEELSERRDSRTLARLERIARAHPSERVRREALERYTKAAVPETAIVLLSDRLTTDPSPGVQAAALRRLAKLPDGMGTPAIIEAARAHPNRDLRKAAWRRLEDSDDPRARDAVARDH